MIIDRNQFDLTPHSPFDVHMNRVCARQGPLMHYIWGDGLLTIDTHYNVQTGVWQFNLQHLLTG